MPQAVRDGIIVVLIISGPLVLAAAFIGLLIGILQAATQVQEQTIGSALKIIGVFTLIIFAGFWMYQYLNQYTLRTFTTAFTVVPHRTQKVIPPGAKEDEDFKDQFEERPLKVEPPENPKIPIQTIMSKIPISDFQEPIPIPNKKTQIIENNEQLQESEEEEVPSSWLPQ